jgi:hypothetical protein
MFFRKNEAGGRLLARETTCIGDWSARNLEKEGPQVVHTLNTMTSRRSLRSKSDSTAADLGTTTRRAALSDRMNRTNSTLASHGSLKAPPPDAAEEITNSTQPDRSALEGGGVGATAAGLAVGAPCAVHFGLKSDYFGPRKGLEGWFPAKVERVTGSANRPTITAKYTDHAVSKGVPLSDVRWLRRQGSWDFWTPALDDSTDEVVFADSAPDVLYPGDVVCALFQQGQVNANPDAWYRGRVLATRTVRSKDAGGEWKMADIGYDDDDFERNVPYSGPYGSSSIMLLERGADNPLWLNGLIVPLPSQTWKTCHSGRVQTMESLSASQQSSLTTLLVSVHYELDGERVSELRSYKEVVQSLVDHELERMADAPVEGSVDVHSASSKPLPCPQECLRKVFVAMAAPLQPNRASGRRRPQAKATSYCSDDEESEDDDDMDDDLGLAAFVEKKTLRGRAPNATAKAKTCDDDDEANGNDKVVRKSGRVKRERAPVSSSSATVPPPRKVSRPLTAPTKKPLPWSDDVAAVAESIRNLTLPDPIPPPSLPLRPLDHSSAHHLGQSLNSSDSVSAADLLTFMGSMHGTSMALRVATPVCKCCRCWPHYLTLAALPHTCCLIFEFRSNA